MNLLTTNELTFGFDADLLFQNFNLALAAGEVLHLQGANGVGKTTLLRILAGLLRPQSGGVTWQGQEIMDIRAEYSQDLLYLGTRLGLKAALSVFDNLHLQAVLAGCPTADLGSAIQALGLQSYINKPLASLSTGLARRVALCRLLTPYRRLWLLDEPYSGLDSLAVSWLSKTIAQHAALGGIVIFTSHQPVTIENTIVQEKIVCR